MSDLFDQDHTKTLFAEILLPVPIEKYFTYRIPTEWIPFAQLGVRAIVQFGKQKIQTGIICGLHHQAPVQYEVKNILEIIDDSAIITPKQLNLWKWMAEYYMCYQGDVMNASLPSGLKLSSESNIQHNPNFNFEEPPTPLSDNEYLLLKAIIASDGLSYTEAAKAIPVKNAYPVVRSLIKKEAIMIYEQIKDKYSPKMKRMLKLKAELANNKDALQSLFEELESKSQKQKQLEILLRYLQHVPVFQNPEQNEEGMERSALLKEDLSDSALKTLIKNGWMEEFQVIVPRFKYIKETIGPSPLSTAQQKAKEEIMMAFQQHQTTLLQGVTGSGKTEIYIQLILEALQGGNQVLFLLPEIALTTQIVGRLQKVFGGKMAVYHSRFSDNERVEVWQGLLSGRFELIVGVRSSVLLPFDNLGLIIVDEEHETSYKQYDPAPRYHARDVALVLGQQHQAKVLLGSATPSLESYFQAQNQKFGYVILAERFAEAQMPQLVLADMIREKKRKTMVQDFSQDLLESMRLAIQNKEQVIIFQNRRGYSPYLSCDECGHVPHCKNCDVSLTYHQFAEQLRCHYCGYKEPMPNTCEACGAHKLQTIGMGTEKIEEEIASLIPEAKIQRMDLETTRKKNSYQEIIDDFSEHKTDILVGTQMLSKGLDFDHVTLVGIMDADSLLHFPDFRASERAYQMITQVSGRAGRKEKMGKVVIQTRNTENHTLKYVLRSDLKGFYDYELKEREQFRYPPFTRLIKITLRHPEKPVVQKAGKGFQKQLQEALGSFRVSDPHEPMISKIRNKYLSEIIVRIERGNTEHNLIKQAIRQKSYLILSDKSFKGIEIVYDVDTY